MIRRGVRPLVLVAALVPLYLGAQLLLLGRVAPVLLFVPLVAVAAYEAADATGRRRSEENRRSRPATPGTGDGLVAGCGSTDEDRPG